MNLVDLYQRASQYIIQGEYTAAAQLYEEAIELHPDIKSSYWHLGLALLLNGQEEDAQAAWMVGMVEAEPEQLEIWTQELIQVLWTEAMRRETLADYTTALPIRQQIREIAPDNTNNLLILLLLEIELETYDADSDVNRELIEQLQASPHPPINPALLTELLDKLLDRVPLAPWMVDFVAACLPHISKEVYVDIVLARTTDLAYVASRPELAAQLAELCWQANPDNIEILGFLAAFYQNATEYAKGIETARKYASLVQTVPDRLFANYLILRGLVSSTGRWEEAVAALEHHEALFAALSQETATTFPPAAIMRLVNTSYFFPYFRDDLKKNRAVHNHIGQLYQTATQQNAADQLPRFQQQRSKPEVSSRPLKIGYLSHCLGRHSVGWLARSLFQHHNRDRVELYGYFVNYRSNDPVQEWYESQVAHSYSSDSTAQESIWQIAEKIAQDEIDILVDLDSLTLDLSCHIVALKPAPVQVTWLGWDASGIPAIDYFIADPYVLPDWADDYYQEKIWRLPQTYIGLDGFEVAIPTLRRDELGIPDDAIVYFCVQNSYKRHPVISRLQMQIIREVPNSYLLIKGIADETLLKQFFLQLAEEVGVESDRLRFLPGLSTEAMHRASLRLADVVLDTYPYNGATTTLETLWMEIPLVTRVGETFSGRNSYAMLKNVGVTEGIAWTNEDYVKWGIQFGTDAALRQKVAWQLRIAKHTSPLWNGKQFAQTMEQAYEQMWASYLRTSQQSAIS
jgi:predicted O-linked N-acetylglucosamine transferase (SPINDLY family)